MLLFDYLPCVTRKRTSPMWRQTSAIGWRVWAGNPTTSRSPQSQACSPAAMRPSQLCLFPYTSWSWPTYHRSWECLLQLLHSNRPTRTCHSPRRMRRDGWVPGDCLFVLHRLLNQWNTLYLQHFWPIFKTFPIWKKGHGIKQIIPRIDLCPSMS